MITVICATHRPQNQTLRIVEKYKAILEQLGERVTLMRMDELPADFVFTESFGERSEKMEKIIAERLVPAEKLVIISPEYNGSYPGIFKAMLDGIKPRIWKGKKVALVGVATGRAGNLRGMDHLTDVLHYLRMEVFSYKIPISKLDLLLSVDGELVDEATIAVLTQQAKEFLQF
jgi:NAD(P)H-dependent FMN reductase